MFSLEKSIRLQSTIIIARAGSLETAWNVEWSSERSSVKCGHQGKNKMCGLKVWRVDHVNFIKSLLDFRKENSLGRTL